MIDPLPIIKEKNWPVVAGTTASVFLLGAFGALYFVPDKTSEWIQNLGNLGQLVSGIFAPIAFVWVVVAVLLQSRELKLQREELSNSRRALELQHEELRKTVEQHVQQTKIMTEEFAQKSQAAQTSLAEEVILQLCARMVDICEDLTIRGKVDESRPRPVFGLGPLHFSIGKKDDLLALYRERNYIAFFDYVHRSIISSIGFLEQVNSIAVAARHYGGGHVGRVALSSVTMLFNSIEEKVRDENLVQLESRLNACNFYTVKALVDDLQSAIVELDE